MYKQKLPEQAKAFVADPIVGNAYHINTFAIILLARLQG